MTWETDLQDVRRRLAELDPERELASARAAATSARWARGEFFLPLPLIARERLSVQGGWEDAPEHEDWTAERVELDADGRPVVHVLGAGSFMERVNELWSWEADGSLLEIELMGWGPHVRRWRDGHVVCASEGDRVKVQLLSERRSDAAEVDDDGLWAVATAWDGDRLLRVRERVGGGALARASGADEAIGPATTADLAAALARAAALVPNEVVWDGRIERPEPWPEDAALVEPLAVALDRALREAVAASGVAEPFVLEVPPRRDFPSFPPLARIASAAWRERMRRAVSRDGAAVDTLHRAVDAGEGAVLDLVDRLDEVTLRRCRALSTALRPGARIDMDRAAPNVAEAVEVRLAELLNATPPPGAAEPFVALVGPGDAYESTTAADRARATAGEARYAAFEASVASLKPPVAGVPADRATLEAHLRDGGLADHARRLARTVAQESFQLEPGRGRSHLGGPALLPRGEAWPGDLTFLAAIDLAELGRGPGWLLFYADLEDEPAEAYAVRFADDPVEADGPALAPRPVLARPALTLPRGSEFHETLGLDPVEGETYDELTEPLTALDGHWFGGHVKTPQGADPDDDSLLLLHLGWDEEFGLQYGDGGTIQFRIAPDALAAGDFASAFVVTDSY